LKSGERFEERPGWGEERPGWGEERLWRSGLAERLWRSGSAERFSGIVTRVLGEASPRTVEQAERVITHTLPADYAWPGNIRELQQCVRRVLLTGTYQGAPLAKISSGVHLRKSDALQARARAPYESTGNYGAVARAMGIDRRTVKKYTG
jgi:transcriptional regulator with GAF, ATPase, and Fis domain